MTPSSRFIENVQISINVTRFIIVYENKMALSYLLKLSVQINVKSLAVNGPSLLSFPVCCIPAGPLWLSRDF